MKINRNVAMDIVRIFALFCVISVHYFLYNGFYDEPLINGRMFVMTLMRTFFMICVPLFIVLSGYLMNGKTISKKYYKGLNKTLLTYLGASVFCLIFRVFYLHEIISKRQMVLGMFGFYNAAYSWYIEMYIGLFLLIPFLNLIYNNLDGKKLKQLLLLSLLVLTAIPQVTNIYNFGISEWWKAPIEEYVKILPSWWINIYPITYYFLGCYLHEYKVTMRKTINFLLIGASALFFGYLNFYWSNKAIFVQGPYQSWGALPNVIMTVLVFILIANFNLSRLPALSKRFIAKLSDLCLGAYLLSVIFDRFFYMKLQVAEPQVDMRLEYYFVIVPLVFILSLTLSYLLDLLISFCKKCIFISVNLLKKARKNLS